MRWLFLAALIATPALAHGESTAGKYWLHYHSQHTERAFGLYANKAECEAAGIEAYGKGSPMWSCVPVPR